LPPLRAADSLRNTNNLSDRSRSGCPTASWRWCSWPIIEVEVASRDASNTGARLGGAAFPVTKTLDGFDVGTSSVKRATFDYLVSLEWVAARENLCLVGPAGTGGSHLLVALGHHAVDASMRSATLRASGGRLALSAIPSGAPPDRRGRGSGLERRNDDRVP